MPRRADESWWFDARTMSIVNAATALLVLSAALFAMTGLAYLAAPGLLLSVLGIESTSTTEFLLRTVGVALLSAAGFVWAARDGGSRQVRLVLVGLGAYYVLSSVVDVAAFAQGVVGLASRRQSLPSASNCPARKSRSAWFVANWVARA